MKDLLKEAIADAKAVRQTALANAKMALEEAFTPRLQSMLSAKLAEDLSDDESKPVEGDEEEEGTEMKEKPEVEEGDYSDNDDMPEEGYNMSEDDEVIEDDDMPEEGDEDALPSKKDDLDLDEIIRELEEDEDPTIPEEDDDDVPEEGGHMSDEVDEEINIDEIIRSLREDDEQELPEEEEKEVTEEEEEEKKADLEEAYNVIRFLKSKINEVNLLNAKLLYSNKLFRNFSLNEGQKMKVIENFDRAFTLREVKLVYSTLAEGFKMPSTRKVVKESFASKPIASTKPARQIISESAALANRFKKLAGLK